MNTTISRYEHDVMQEPSMKGPLITSSLFHAIIFIIAAVGMPFVAKDPSIITNAINIEIVEISDVTQAPEISKLKPKQPKAEEPKPAKPPKAEKKPEPELAEPAPPKIEEKKPEQPKEKPKPPEKSEEKPKEEKKSSFESLLNNIAPDIEDVAEEQPEDIGEEQGAEISQIAALGERLTISERDAIGQQLYPCWNVPAGARMAENLAVEIRVFLNRDGSIRDTQILDQGRYSRDTHFRAAADSANRALRNPRCTPLKFPPDKYDQLKQFVFRFDPKDML